MIASRILTIISKYISILDSNKTNRGPAATSSNISFIYKKLMQAFWKSLCLVKEFFFVNFFKGVFWGMLWQVSHQFGIFFHYTVNLSLHLVVYYLAKPFWSYVSASHICCSWCLACLCHCQYDSICREF